MPREKSSGTATVRDVASLAGVSAQTVSRVINNHPNVSAETLDRVHQAIAALNYQPNRAARSLSTGKSGIIQVIVFEMFHLWMLPQMENTAYNNGFQLQFVSLHQKFSLAELRQKLQEITAGQVDGIVLIMPWVNVSYAELVTLTQGIPFVVVGASLGYNTNCILIDQAHGTRLLVEHLLELGHREIATITGAIDQVYDARIRYETLVGLLRDQNLTLQATIGGNFTMESGYQGMHSLLDTGQSFSAVVCGNDEMALGAMRAAVERGLQIPHQCSIVGFDNQHFAAFSQPSLTTIQQDFEALGLQSIQHLTALIEQPDHTPYQRTIYPKLIVRESSAQAPTLSRV